MANSETIADDPKPKDPQETYPSKTSSRPLFELNSILRVPTEVGEVHLCAHHEHVNETLDAAQNQQGSQILVFATKSGDLILLKVRNGEAPVVKRVPWYLDPEKAVVALSFDPSGSWLLVVGADASFALVPVITILSGTSSGTISRHGWATGDVTCFPSQASSLRPTSVTWWENAQWGPVAILGGTQGELVFIDLASGIAVGTANVAGAVKSLHLCHDEDSVFLLITNCNREQWKLLLERKKDGYCWPLDRAEGDSADLGSNGGFPSRGQHIPARSRLQGLKHFSVEKLSIIKQKIVETRKATSVGAGTLGLSSGSRSKETEDGSLQRKSELKSGNVWQCIESVTPEKLASHLGETFISPQNFRGLPLLSGYYAPFSLLTVHSMDPPTVPLCIHKLPPNCKDVLLTDRFIFITNPSSQILTVVSCKLSESTPEENNEFNPESVIQSFSFADGEQLLGIFKKTGAKAKKEEKGLRGGASVLRGGNNSKSVGISWDKKQASASILLNLNLSQSSTIENGGMKKSGSFSSDTSPSFIRTVERIHVLSSENREVDTCIAVTTCGAYELQLRQCPTDLFLELALKKGELEEAERVAQVFNLNLQHLLEIAGDLELASKSFVQAIAFYKLSRCQHLKSVLKFAAGGHSVELLSFIETVFSSGGSDLAPSERIHLSNLAVMAHVERVLRSSASSSSSLSDDSGKVAKRSYSPTLMGKFLRFLHDNQHYDEVLAVSVVGQTALWEPLKFLCSRRGLHREALSSLSRFLKSVAEDGLKGNDLISHKLGSSTSPVAATLLDSGLWECLSEPALLQPLLEKPELAAAHMSFINTFLPVLTIPSLERLAALYDPSSPVFHSCLLKMFIDYQKSQNLGISPISVEDGSSSSSHPIGDMLEMFVKIMLYLSHKRCGDVPQYHPELMQWNGGARNGLGGSQENHKREKIMEHPLAAGYAHSALVWNKGVLTWGNAAHGCLGHGPTMSRYGFPQDVSSFSSLGIEVLSVSCGRQHTLALTSNGVYAWGSAQFGQIGVGMSSGQSPYPTLVESLCEEHIVEISAGQYHSMALTEDGRVYTWGWGVYGQLGHGGVEDCVVPTVVKALQGKEKITRICGGHCHSLALTDDGNLLAWGSSVFGQLGHGAMGKSSLPVKVLLPEPVTMMATAYFHNLAVGISNCLYSWGSSPLVLRIQAQAQKKARLILHQQQQQQRPLSPQKSTINGRKPASKSTDQEQKNVVDGDASAGVEESSEDGGRSEVQTAEGESQAHLLPSIVNTSLVLGPITQISCGCHHSALLTKDGTVYTWGRSLDGQVGNGTRREALFPAPLTSPPPAPPASAPPPNSSTTLPILTRLRASHIACGCEFTLALDKSSGKLWAWGSNAMAQLGKDLEESSRSAIQGSVVMLKSTKRVIKHPHGVQNSKDLPYLVPWLPPALPTSAPAENISLPSIPQGKEEVPKYGHLTLHKTLEFFHKYYNSQRLLFNCVELENYQAAAKIVALESHFHQALAYQLKALYLASKSSSSPEKEKKAGTGREGILRVEEEEEDEELSKVGIEVMLRGSRRCETHSFAIQGGAEEMSEGGGGIPSPACPCEEDSDAQLASKERGILDRSKATESSLMFSGDINAKKEPSTSKSPEKISSVCRQECVESVRNGLSFGICNVSGNEGNECGKAADEPWSEVDEKDKGETKMSVLKPEEELAYRASLVVEHYASLLEEEGHLMIRRLLEQGINFWLAHSLPLSCLETLLIKHMSKFFYPLGLMLFCDWNVDAEEGGEVKEGERSSAPGSVLGQLSTRFCLQLCSTLLSHIRHKKIAYPEYVELLAQVMAMQAAPFGRDNGGGPPATGTPQPPVLSPDIPYTPEHAMEAVLENVGLIGSGIDSLPNPIHMSGDAVMDVLDAEKASCTKEDQEMSESFVLSKKKDQRGVEAVVFSCGHHFRADRFHQSVLPETELALLGLHHPLPHTARLVRGLFSATIAPKRASSPTLQLACPNCVLSHLQAQVR